MYEQEDQNNEMKQEQQYNLHLPQYAEVQSQKIFMGGLDYSLLQKQKDQDKKKGLLTNIKNQLFNMEKKIDSRTVKIDPTKSNTDGQSIKLIDEQSIKLIQPINNLQNIKPLVNSSTFYLFDSNYHFGKQTPQIITKRLGRMNKQPAYIKVALQTINKFKKILETPIVDFDKIKKDKAFKNLIQSQSSQSDNQSSDNIFGSDSQEKGQKNRKQIQLFNFGQKLSLGVKDQEIFWKKIQSASKEVEGQSSINQNLFQTQEQKDKYEFMRKKVKKITVQDELDGYGQCYIPSGPSFQQMKQYRSQGIQIWGDLKASKKIEKKQNVGREYEIVKKIIDEKIKNK